MSKGVDMSSILDKRIEDIEAPKPVPVGTYLGTILSVPEDATFEKTDEKTGEKVKVPACRVKVGLREMKEGDEEALAAAGGLSRRDGKPKEVQMTYYLEEDNLHKLKKLGETCGIKSPTLGGIFEELPGSEVLVSIGLRADRQDDTIFYNQVNKMVGTAG